MPVTKLPATHGPRWASRLGPRELSPPPLLGKRLDHGHGGWCLSLASDI